MPVFMAFGWAGEEAATTFALSQMELFIESLYFNLPRETQAQFPYRGLDRASQSVYLAAEEDPTEGPYIAFSARPASWEQSFIISDKAALKKAYAVASARPASFFDFLAELGGNWKLRIQQMEYDAEQKTATHYKDIYNDSTSALSDEQLASDVERAAFLNSEDQWIVPFFLSRRQDAEKVAAMRLAVIPSTVEDVNALVPLVKLLTGKTRKAKKKARPAPPPPTAQMEAVEASLDDDAEQFTYISELLSLHIRRGFINLTPRHWPFFSINARTETRPVTILYGEHKDKKCSVWRLVPDDQARIVLSPTAHDWLEEHFEPGDSVKVQAIKTKDDDITLTLGGVE
ncbi:MAG: hypothetical protein PVH18_02835 [Chloroflexota bacterium]